MKFHVADILAKLGVSLYGEAAATRPPGIRPPRCAAPSEPDLARLDALQAEIGAGESVSDLLRLDRAFHLLTYSRCEVEPLSRLIVRLWHSTERYRRLFVTITGPSRRWVINAERNLLLDAVRRQDVIDTGRHFEVHIRRTRVERPRRPETFR